MRARKKTAKPVELKVLSLKIRKDVWLAWKMRAAVLGTTMSELGEEVMGEHLKKPKRRK